MMIADLGCVSNESFVMSKCTKESSNVDKEFFVDLLLIWRMCVRAL